MVRNLRTIGFQELLAFSEVVKRGGVTAAAQELNVAKSVISGQVSKLEQRLSVKLLNRHSRRVSLTKEGAKLLPRIESLLAEGERLFLEAEQEENLPQGLVKIAATPEFAQWVLVHFFPLVAERFPGIRIVLKTAYDFEDLQDPSFDLAFRINKVNDDRLVARKMGEFHRCFYASPDLEGLDQLRSPNDLSKLPCLGFSDSVNQHVWHTENSKNGKKVSVPISSVNAARNFNILVEMASLTCGVCYVPSFIAQQKIAQQQLIRVLPQWHSKASDVYLVSRFGVDRIARIKAVLDLAKECAPDLLARAL